MHPLAAHRTPPVLWEASEAEVAEHTPAVELVHALAGERSATAVAARGVRLRKRSDAAAHEHGGKVGHGNLFAYAPESPSAHMSVPALNGYPGLARNEKSPLLATFSLG
jgi:hypothetical protein